MNDEETIFKKIKRLEDDLRGYKTSQPIGTDSVVTYTTSTNNIWDVETTLPANNLGFGNSSNINYNVSFVARDQIAPFARIRVFAQSNIPVYYVATDVTFTTMSTLEVSPGDYIFYSTPEELANPQLVKFQVRVSGPQFTAFKLKFMVDATDYGRMTIIKETPTGGELIIP